MLKSSPRSQDYRACHESRTLLFFFIACYLLLLACNLCTLNNKFFESFNLSYLQTYSLVFLNLVDHLKTLLFTILSSPAAKKPASTFKTILRKGQKSVFACFVTLSCPCMYQNHAKRVIADNHKLTLIMRWNCYYSKNVQKFFFL